MDDQYLQSIESFLKDYDIDNYKIKADENGINVYCNLKEPAKYMTFRLEITKQGNNFTCTTSI